jgi:YesN/AraC family two-component response regulator
MVLCTPHTLIVDDETFIRDGLMMALRDSYVVHQAATGEEACTILKRYPVSAIILDEVLGPERGLDFVQEFRKLSAARVIVLTGYTTEELFLRAIEVKVDGYLKKPPNLVKLRADLARLVQPAICAEQPLAQASRLMDEHPERPHTTSTLAQEVGMSEAHFRRCFKEACGKTPRQYLTEVRMQRAAERLGSPPAGVADTSYGVGIHSFPTFRRLFTRRFGCSPTEFRKRHTPRSDSSDPEDPDSSQPDQN